MNNYKANVKFKFELKISKYFQKDIYLIQNLNYQKINFKIIKIKLIIKNKIILF